MKGSTGQYFSSMIVMQPYFSGCSFSGLATASLVLGPIPVSPVPTEGSHLLPPPNHKRTVSSNTLAHHLKTPS